LPGPLSFVASAPVFSADGKTLYVARFNGPIQAWDAETGKELPAVDKGKSSALSLVVSRDGRRLAAADHPQVRGSRREIIVWDLAEGRELRRLPPPDRTAAWSLALSADGNALAAVGGDVNRGITKAGGFLVVWDLRSGEQKLARTGLDNNLVSVAFSADGRSLVTGGADGAVRLWEAATGQERHRFTGHETGVYAPTFSADGKLIAAASSDAPVFVWDVTGCYDKAPQTSPPPASSWDDLRDGNAANAFTAMRQLLRRPGPAVALLRERLKSTPEAAGPSEPERRRALRAVEVLEMLGTPEARELLAALAGGAKESLLTREARSAVERLNGR
jgi:WD40 repeat protein